MFNESSVSFQAEDLFMEHGKLSPVATTSPPALSSKLQSRKREEDIETPPRYTSSPNVQIVADLSEHSRSHLSISHEEIS